MELLDVIQKICQTNYQAMSPTELVIGTVVSASPLQISVNTTMAPLQQSVLYLTSSVVPLTLSSLSHTHTTEGQQSSQALEDVVCTQNGQALANDSGTITLNPGLAVGDKVLLLRVQKGQKFVVLSRVF